MNILVTGGLGFVGINLVRGLAVPAVILPPPSAIVVAFAGSTGVLWADFVQTILRGGLSGYAIGCGAGFLTGIAIEQKEVR